LGSDTSSCGLYTRDVPTHLASSVIGQLMAAVNIVCTPLYNALVVDLSYYIYGAETWTLTKSDEQLKL